MIRDGRLLLLLLLLLLLPCSLFGAPCACGLLALLCWRSFCCLLLLLLLLFSSSHCFIGCTCPGLLLWLLFCAC